MQSKKYCCFFGEQVENETLEGVVEACIRGIITENHITHFLTGGTSPFDELCAGAYAYRNLQYSKRKHLAAIWDLAEDPARR